MDTTFVSTIKDLAPASIAVLLMGWVLWQVIKGQMESAKKDREWFVQFVEENNHQKSDMIREHTESVVSVKNAIEANTKVVEKLADKL